MALTNRILEIQGGKVAGVAQADGVSVFRGLPYARPPLGALRWRAPQPVEPWTGVRPAESFGPRCIQPSRAPTSIGYFEPEAESEDCLYLNVWTAAREADKARPVMVWFHGGAFYLGSGAVPLFDGANLARRGAVVVTVNYRLGRLGFLAHPLLTRESAGKGSGNYGMLDQVAALRWVRDNIAVFGGDPDRVTVFGQSAGSIAGAGHMASPLSRGLFHRLIGQSGGMFGPVCATSGTGDSMQSLEAAERSGEALARALGATTLEDLRGRDAQELQLARPLGDASEVFDPSQAPRGAFDTAFPCVDGYFLPEGAFAAFAAGRQNDVPLITGSVANEGATMPSAASLDAFLAQARTDFGPAAERFLQLFPAGSDGEARLASRTAVGYRNFIWQNWTWARLHARTGRAGVYYYHVSRAPPVPPKTDYFEGSAGQFGAFHGSEIPYVFDNLQVRPWPWEKTDRLLAGAMSGYWLNFAATGDPNGEGLPTWPAFDDERRATMHFGDDLFIGAPPHLARLAFWDDDFGSQR